MRLTFAGTPVFAERALDALLRAGHDVALVLTRPDKPAGRGQKTLASPVRQCADAHGLPVFQPRTLRDPEAEARLRAAAGEVMVVAAYGLILPAAVLAIPAHGCLNIHASLLPRWRGAAPIQRAIEAGDARTGISIMQMDEGLDTGAVLLEAPLDIGADETAASLHDRLADLGAQAIVQALARLARGGLVARPQPAEGVTYATKLDKRESPIDWQLPARRIVDKVRAFDPVPGASMTLVRLPEQPLKVWRTRVADPLGAPLAPDAAARGGAEPGTVLAVDAHAVTVACGEATAIQLLELQRPGGRRLPVAEFLRGLALHPGDRMQAPPR
jgi:methionyl-tRNA formyltransferase